MDRIEWLLGAIFTVLMFGFYFVIMILWSIRGELKKTKQTFK